MLSQKDAVYQATMAVLKQNKVELEDGQDIREAISGNMQLRGQIRDLVFEGLRSGQVTFGSSEKKQDDGALKTYSTGLISNWFRKDKRLNGGQRYQPATSKNQGKEQSEQLSGSSYERRIRAMQGAIEATDDQELKTALEAQIEDILDQEKLEAKLAEDVKAGRYKDDDDIDSDESDDGPKTDEDEDEDEDEEPEENEDSGHEVDQDNPPSMGSGHKGAVTDPEHDKRLKRNETPELQKSRQEAGHKGGTSVRDEHGSDFFSQIGQKGGLSRGPNRSLRRSPKSENDEKEGDNIFIKMLKKRTA